MSAVEQEHRSTCNAVTLCPCGAPRPAWRPYCVRCANARRRAGQAPTPEAKQRARARAYVRTYLRRGKLVKQPCADCGAIEVEAHHPDYSRPLDVVWLCPECHRRRHGVADVRRPRGSKADGSAGKPPELFEFYHSLHERGESTESLARQLHVSRPVVCKLIGLLKRRRGRTWEGLLALLTPTERDLLARAGDSVAWASKQLAKRPRWNAEKVAGLAETYPARFEDERDRLRRAEADSFFSIPTSTKAIA